MPNTGNMGLPICLFAYGTQGLGIAAAISALIVLCHFTLGVFLADRKFDLSVFLKTHLLCNYNFSNFSIL